MAEKSPAFQWYPKDFDTDEVVRLLPLAGIGFYVKLLNHDWLNTGIPDDPALLAKIAGCKKRDAARWWELLKTKFEPLEEGLKRVSNVRLKGERQRQLRFAQKQSLIAQNPRLSRRKQTHDSSHRLAKPSPPSSTPERTPYSPPKSDTRLASSGNLPDDGFLNLQESYPKKTRIHAGEATEAYHRVVESAADPPKTLEAVRAGLDRMRAFAESTGTAPKYLPSFADFLNDARFLEPWTEDGAVPFDESRLTRIPLCEECRLVTQDCPSKIRKYAEKKGLGFCECSPKTSSTLPTSTPLSPNGLGSESRAGNGSASAPSTMSEPRRSA